MTLRFGSVCSGIEAASVAWNPLGWEAAWFSEIEPFPCSVLEHHYPHVPNVGDMTTITERILSGELEAPDILCGGTPCQAFSVAGNRASLDDDRGNLSLVFCEIANAIDSVRRERGEKPVIIFWENVPGCLNTKDNFFGCFLAELAGETVALEPPGGKWTDAGCVSGPARTVAWRCLDAQFFGVAQRRRRIYVCAVESGAGAIDPRTVLFEWSGLRRDTVPSRKTVEEIAAAASGGVGGGGSEGVVGAIDCRIPAQRAQNAQSGHYVPVRPESCFWDGSQVAGTLTKQGASGSQRMPDKGNFGAVIQYASEVSPTVTNGPPFSRTGNERVEADALVSYGIPGNWIGRAPENGGNAVEPMDNIAPCLTTADKHGVAYSPTPVGTDCYNGAITGDIAATMGTPGSSVNASGPTVAVPIAFKPGQSAAAHTLGAQENIACTLEGGGGGNNKQAVAYPINTMTLGGRPDPVNDAKMTIGVGADGDPQYTISASHSHAVAHGGVYTFRCESCEEVFQLEEGARIECWCGESENIQRVPPHVFKIRGGSPVDTGVQGGKPGKSAGKGYLGQDEQTFTLASTQDQFVMTSVAFAQNTRDEVRLVGGDGQMSGALAAQPGMKQTTYVATGQAPQQVGMLVRRLTPVECARLQGFPDDYLSQVKHRGKPAADGPMYKALGNSWAVPVVRWIGSRIAREYQLSVQSSTAGTDVE